MFTYIKPEFMIHAFKQQRDSLLSDRSICVARLGDYAVSMDKVDDNTFSLSLEKITTGAQFAGRIFNVETSEEEEIIPLVNDLFHKMQSIYDKEIFDRRENIWKWYAMRWLEEQDISLDEYLDSRMLNNTPDEYIHWKSFEEYIASDYLNVASTMDIIESFAEGEEERESYKSFAAKDIVELRQRNSLEAMQEIFDMHDEQKTRKAYSFGVDIVAGSRNEAREKLKTLLKGLEEGEVYIRG